MPTGLAVLMTKLFVCQLTGNNLGTHNVFFSQLQLSQSFLGQLKQHVGIHMCKLKSSCVVAALGTIMIT